MAGDRGHAQQSHEPEQDGGTTGREPWPPKQPQPESITAGMIRLRSMLSPSGTIRKTPSAYPIWVSADVRGRHCRATRQNPRQSAPAGAVPSRDCRQMRRRQWRIAVSAPWDMPTGWDCGCVSKVVKLQSRRRRRIRIRSRSAPLQRRERQRRLRCPRAGRNAPAGSPS